MKLAEIVREAGLYELTPELPSMEQADITRAIVSDILSDVIQNAPQGGLLITGQSHLNVVAVAVKTGLAAVLFAYGRMPDESVRTKAVEHGIRLYRSQESPFDLVGQLYQLGLRGAEEAGK